MQKKFMIMIVFCFLLIISAVFADSLEEAIKTYVPITDWFSLSEAKKAEIPEGLTNREEEIFRAGYAAGHYNGLHPGYIPGQYVINKKTKKFHLTNCNNTLSIESENRELSELTPEELINKGYKPCGMCHPESSQQ